MHIKYTKSKQTEDTDLGRVQHNPSMHPMVVRHRRCYSCQTCHSTSPWGLRQSLCGPVHSGGVGRRSALRSRPADQSGSRTHSNTTVKMQWRRMLMFDNMLTYFHLLSVFCPSLRCCCPLVVPVIRGEVPRSWLLSYFLSLFFPLLIFLSLHSLYTVSNPSICCCWSPFSSHSFQIPLYTVLPLQSPSSSPSFFRSLSGNLISSPIFHLPFFPHVRPISAHSSPVSS